MGYKAFTLQTNLRHGILAALTTLAVLFSGNSASAQYSEIGFSLGGFHYSGDLVREFRPATARPGGSVFYRLNVSEPLSIKVSLTGGLLAGDDSPPYDAFAAERNAAFEVFLLEGALNLEYHFLDFKSEKAAVNYSPYVFIGVGIFYFNGQDNPYESYSRMQPVIPLGLGMKYVVSPKVILGLELGARKTFTDHLDNVSTGDQSVKDYRYGNWYSNDWYYYLGLSFNYAFYDIPCPYRWK